MKTKSIVLNNDNITINSSNIRAIIERVTEVNVPEYEHRLYVFEHLTYNHQVCYRRIQDWGSDDVTDEVSPIVRERIYSVLENYYKTPYYIS